MRLAAIILFALALASGAAAQNFGDYGLFPGRDAERQGAPSVEDYGRLTNGYVSGGAALDMTQRQVSRFRDNLGAVAGRAPLLGEDLTAAMVAASPTGEARYFPALGAFMMLLIAIGRAASTLFAAYVARPIFVSMQRPDPVSLSDKLPVLAARIGLTAVALLITLATAVAVGWGFYPEDNETAVRFAILILGAYLAVSFADALWRMILAPFLRQYRMPALADADARRIYRWLTLLTLVEFGLAAFGLWIGSLDINIRSRALVEVIGTAATCGLALWAAWSSRRAISSAILDGGTARDAAWPAVAAAGLWLPALTAYLTAAWAMRTWQAVMDMPMGPRPLSATFAVVVAAMLCYALLVFLAERAAERRGAATAPRDSAAPQEHRPPAPVAASRSGMRSFVDLARRAASFLALGVGVWAMVLVWGGRDAFDEGRPLDTAQDVIDLLFVSYIVYHALRIWIDRRIEAEGGFEVEVEPGDEGGASAATRLATLLPLVRNFALTLIVASSAIFVAMELGLNVAPLLGGAGIIGIAIGFGSQALVRDILSGAFFLFDDAFRKGEYIDIGGVKGTVEQISLRSFQLRHHLGALHTVPFGEIKHLTNFSRDWVMMKLPLRLTYDTDPEQVRKIVKKIGQELLTHPEEGHKFMQPLKSQGVYMMDDSAMIVRVKYMTRPGDQWTTRKLVYNRIREEFERNGIKFAHREVTVRIPELEGDRERGLTDGEMRAIGAAARRAVDDADAEAAESRRMKAVGDDR